MLPVPTERQQAFLDLTGHLAFFGPGDGGGKTLTLLMAAVSAATEGKAAIFITPKKRHLNEIIWQYFPYLSARATGLRVRPFTLLFPGGGSLRCATAAQAHRGYAYDFAAIDDADRIPAATVRRLLATASVARLAGSERLDSDLVMQAMPSTDPHHVNPLVIEKGD